MTSGSRKRFGDGACRTKRLFALLGATLIASAVLAVPSRAMPIDPGVRGGYPLPPTRDGGADAGRFSA
jgi:hypothetical protein